MSDEFRRKRKLIKRSNIKRLYGLGTWIRTRINGVRVLYSYQTSIQLHHTPSCKVTRGGVYRVGFHRPILSQSRPMKKNVENCAGGPVLVGPGQDRANDFRRDKRVLQLFCVERLLPDQMSPFDRDALCAQTQRRSNEAYYFVPCMLAIASSAGLKAALARLEWSSPILVACATKAAYAILAYSDWI